MMNMEWVIMITVLTVIVMKIVINMNVERLIIIRLIGTFATDQGMGIMDGMIIITMMKNMENMEIKNYQQKMEIISQQVLVAIILMTNWTSRLQKHLTFLAPRKLCPWLTRKEWV